MDRIPEPVRYDPKANLNRIGSDQKMFFKKTSDKNEFSLVRKDDDSSKAFDAFKEIGWLMPRP